MKKLSIKILTCAITASISVSSMASGPRVTNTLFQAAHNEVVAIDTPALYSNHTENGGLAFEIVNAALKSESDSASLTTYPIQKMVNYYLTQEKVLATLTMQWITAENNNKNLVGLPVALVQEQLYFYKPSHPNWGAENTTLANLKGFTYGAHVGEDTSAYKAAKIKVVYGQSLFLLKKLKAQKVDFVKMPQLSANDIINTHFAKEADLFGVMRTAPENSVCKIIFNLQNPEASQVINKYRKGLTTILGNGEYQAIVEKYVASPQLAAQLTEDFKKLWQKESQK